MEIAAAKRRSTNLSGLPEEILHKILGLLPTRTAVSTSTLSKIWHHRFHWIRKLKFRYPHVRLDNPDPGIDARFVDFVNRVLAVRLPSDLEKFSLTLTREIEEAHINAWIAYALERNVKHLKIAILELVGELDYELPQGIFAARTLVRLKISASYFNIIPLEGLVVDLPNLKSLHLDSIAFGQDASAAAGFVTLLSGCPRIEELIMQDIEWFRWESSTVASNSLQRFKFFYLDAAGEGDHDRAPQSISFHTPNLLYFDYSDDVANLYPTLDFVSLTGARIRLQTTVEENYEEEEAVVAPADASALFLGINRVKTLYLFSDTVEVLTLHCMHIPEFENLRQLDIECHAGIGWGSLPNLLNNSPNLHTLTLHGLFHEATDRCGHLCPCRDMENDHPSCLLASPVKVVKIFEHAEADQSDGEAEESDGEADERDGVADQDEARFLNHVRHFLEKMPNLTDLIVSCVASSSESKKLRILQQLRNTPDVAAPNCRIQVV